MKANFIILASGLSSVVHGLLHFIASGLSSVVRGLLHFIASGLSSVVRRLSMLTMIS